MDIRNNMMLVQPREHHDADRLNALADAIVVRIENGVPVTQELYDEVNDIIGHYTIFE